MIGNFIYSDNFIKPKSQLEEKVYLQKKNFPPISRVWLYQFAIENKEEKLGFSLLVDLIRNEIDKLGEPWIGSSNLNLNQQKFVKRKICPT